MVALMSATEDEALTKLRASNLRERERRTILRDLERGDVTPSEVVAALDGKIDICSAAAAGDDDDDEDMGDARDEDEDEDDDFDDEDDEDERKAA